MARPDEEELRMRFADIWRWRLSRESTVISLAFIARGFFNLIENTLYVIGP
jgi:hypothetical protein